MKEKGTRLLLTLHRCIFIAAALLVAGCASTEGRDPAASATHGYQCKSENGHFIWAPVDQREMPIGRCTGSTASGCTTALDENGYEITCNVATVGKHISAQ